VKKVVASFNPKSFLAKVGEGKAISKFGKNQIVFSQGDVAGAARLNQQLGGTFGTTLKHILLEIASCHSASQDICLNVDDAST